MCRAILCFYLDLKEKENSADSNIAMHAKAFSCWTNAFLEFALCTLGWCHCIVNGYVTFEKNEHVFFFVYFKWYAFDRGCLFFGEKNLDEIGVCRFEILIASNPRNFSWQDACIFEIVIKYNQIGHIFCNSYSHTYTYIIEMEELFKFCFQIVLK